MSRKVWYAPTPPVPMATTPLTKMATSRAPSSTASHAAMRTRLIATIALTIMPVAAISSNRPPSPNATTIEIAEIVVDRNATSQILASGSGRMATSTGGQFPAHIDERRGVDGPRRHAQPGRRKKADGRRDRYPDDVGGPQTLTSGISRDRVIGALE